MLACSYPCFFRLPAWASLTRLHCRFGFLFEKVVKMHLFRLLHGLMVGPDAVPGLEERLQVAGTREACSIVVAEATAAECELLRRAAGVATASAEVDEDAAASLSAGVTKASQLVSVGLAPSEGVAARLLSSWYLRHRRGHRVPTKQRKVHARNWLNSGTRIS